MKQIKETVLTILMVVILLNIRMTVKAEGTGATSWYLYSVSLGHKVVNFNLDDVDSAQTATAVIVDDSNDEVLYELPFSITSSSQKFSLDITNGYLKGGHTYKMYIKDNGNNVTDSQTIQCYNHDYLLYSRGQDYCYPVCYVGSIEKKEGLTINVKAEVGFKEYKGTIDSEGNVYIEYPKQDVGTVVNITYYDEYECSRTLKKTVEDRGFSFPSIKAFHDGVALSCFDKIADDERLCTLVDNKKYYSSYGASGGKEEYTKVVSFPDTESTNIQVWIESKYGSVSEKKSYEVQDCKLDKCEYEISAFRSMAKGTVKANDLKYMPTKVFVELSGQKYTGVISADGSFVVEYPAQANYTDINITFSDNHNCLYTTSRSVYNSLEKFEFYIRYVLPSQASVSDIYEGTRLAAKIGEQVYYSDYAGKDRAVTVKYPSQPVGTPIIFWLEKEDTSKSEEQTFNVYSGAFSATMTARTTNSFGIIGINDVGDYDYDGSVVSAYVMIDGNKYDCVITEKKASEGDAIYDSDDYEDEADEDDGTFYLAAGKYYEYTVSYPVQELGKTVSLYYVDSNGITQTIDKVLENVPPAIKIDSYTSSSTKITGSTVANASVTIKIGKKTYSCRTNSKGKFSKKIKTQKAGTKVKISVLSDDGYYNDKTIKVKKAQGWIELNKSVYKDTKTVSCFITNGKKGDKVKVKVGKKTYTAKVKKTKKYQTVKIKITPKAAGTSVTLTLTDKFGKKKDSYKDIVYIGDKIYVGMSASNALLTTWGKPIRRNDYGLGFEQWVYQSGATTLYVYVSGGKVTNIQKLNY